MRGLEQQRADLAFKARRRGPPDEPPRSRESSQLHAIEGIASGVALSIALWALLILVVTKLMH